MSQDYLLEQLRQTRQRAFERKQEAFANYQVLRDRANNLFAALQQANREYDDARARMNSEFSHLKSCRDHHDSVWQDYSQIRDRLLGRIEDLRDRADQAHAQMGDCFDRAHSEYEYSNKAEAAYWSAQGKSCRETRDELNAQVQQLREELKSAKADAEYKAPRPDSSAFYQAKERFSQVKSKQAQAHTSFKQAKADRDAARATFDQLQKEYEKAQKDFQERLNYLKAQHQQERKRTLDKAGVDYFERDSAKIVKKADGTTQVYHGGLGSGDGIGHGHTTLDAQDKVTYDRQAFAAHGRQNFKDDGQGGWGPYLRGTIEGHEVTVRIGQGRNEGATLIADGILSNKQFKGHSHHNHYGPDLKRGFGRIEDTDGDRGVYTGPGH